MNLFLLIYIFNSTYRKVSFLIGVVKILVNHQLNQHSE